NQILSPGSQQLMKRLAAHIAKDLKTAEHSAVYEEDLMRLWPLPDEREIELREFANEYGFRLRFYHEGLCAIFDKEPPKNETDFKSAKKAHKRSPSLRKE